MVAKDVIVISGRIMCVALETLGAGVVQVRFKPGSKR
jgi:hypothetical protein